MDRRSLLIGATTVFMPSAFLGGCISDKNSTAVACDTSSELDAILCRDDLFLNSARDYATVSMLIGVGLGLGLAVGARFHPLAAIAAGALSGALTYGTLAAAEQYWKYRLEQADSNPSQAKADILRDINHDHEFSIVAVDDVKYTTGVIVHALKNEDHQLLKNAANFTKAKKITARSSAVNKTLNVSVPIYAGVAPIAELPLDGGTRAKLDSILASAATIHEECERQIAIEMGKDAHYG